MKETTEAAPLFPNMEMMKTNIYSAIVSSL